MLCYCVRKSKHRVNKDNTLLYSARFNLVKPSHADSKSVTQMEQKPSTICSFFRELQYDEFNLIQTWVGIRSYAYFNFCAIVTTFYICFCIDLVKMSNKFKRISISMIIIILIIKVDYNYHKNYPRIIWGIFLWKLYNFDNFIRRRLSDHNKITFVSLSPSLSPDGAFLFLYYYYFIFLMGGGDCYFFFETELSLTKQPLCLRPGRSEYSLLMKHLLIQIRKRMTETRFYEPARLSSPSKPLFSLTPLDTTTCLRVVVRENRAKC